MSLAFEKFQFSTDFELDGHTRVIIKFQIQLFHLCMFIFDDDLDELKKMKWLRQQLQ